MLEDRRRPQFSEQVRRSALGLVPVYNMLPRELPTIPDVSSFQRALQEMIKIAAAAERPEWENLLSPRTPMYRHPLHAL